MAKPARDKKGRFVKSQPKQRDYFAGGAYSGGAWYSLPKQSHAGVQVDELTSLNLSSIWRGVSRLSGDVSILPLNVYQRLDTGGKRVVRDNPIFELLSYPNRYQAGRKFRHVIMVHTILWGNAYVEIMRDEDGDPYRLELLDPRKVKSYRDPKTYDLIYKLHGQSVYSGRHKLLPENILHFKGLSLNGDDGLSPIHMATDELGTGIALSQYAGTLFGQGAVPNGVIECPPGWDQTARENFRQAVNDVHQGIKGSNKVAILEEGAKWVATSFNPEQLQMLNARLFTIQEVGRILGLPPHKLGDYSHDANRSLDEKNREYYQTSLKPYCDMIEEECALKLFTVAQRRVFFLEHDMSKLMRATDLERAQTNDILMRNGVITGNEWRSDFGYNPFEEDIRIIPLNMGQVESGVDLDPNPNEGDPVDAPTPDDPEPLDLQDEARAVVIEAARRMVTRETKNLRKAVKRSEVSPEWLDEFYQDHRAILVEALIPALRLYGRATRSKIDPDGFLDRMIERSKTAILEATSVEDLLDGWERDRAEGFATLFREEHQ